MSDPDLGGNKTVFRPSPLQALKGGAQPAPPPLPITPPPPVVAPPSTALPPPPRAGGWRTGLIVVFIVVTVLAIGYIVLQVTHMPLSGSSPARTSQLAPAGEPKADA